MSNTILLKRNGNAAAVPLAANLSLGELSLNYADGVLYFLNSVNAVTVLANANTVSGTQLVNGTSNVVTRANGNVTISSAGTANIFTVTSTGIYTTGLSSVTGNISGGNILTGGVVSATGNVTGSYFIGNGSQLTGISGGGSSTSITNGTSNVVVAASGNVTVAVAGTAAVATFATTGEYVSGVISATGNITGGNISATNHTGTNVSVTGTVTAASTVGGVITGSSISVSGNITGGHVGTVYTNSIINTGANATGNIGSSTLYFNTVFAKATSAQYADLAEMYCADATYAPGTVLDFGGSEEVTATTQSHSTCVAGIVSTNPSYLMNSALDCANAVEVALVGRVPCRVVGTIRKGDRLVASGIPGVATVLNMTKYEPGCIVGKALENYESMTDGVIEVAVGRL